MKVSRIKELLSTYSDDDELMIAWNDRSAFEYILDRELPLEIWEKAVARFDKGDMQEFTDECHYQVVIVKDELEKADSK